MASRICKFRRSFFFSAIVALILPLVAVSPASAALDPVLASARSFVVSQQQTDGGFEVAHFPSFETPDAILALAELAQTGPTWSTAAGRNAVLGVVRDGKTPLDYVDDQVEAADLSPALAAKYLTLVVAPLGLNPRDVDPSNDSPQPVDLVAAMGKGADLDGQYRTGAFNGLVFIALAQWARGCMVPTDLVARLKAAQQANGAFDFSGDPTATGVDIDTTSLTVIALTRAGLSSSDPAIGKALTFLARQHRPSGAWQSFGNDDPNSTSVATLAVAATGQDPTTRVWRDLADPQLAGQPYVSPDAWLRSQQSSDGHIRSPNDSFGVNTFATSQTIEALTRHWFTSKPAAQTVCALPGGPRERFIRRQYERLTHRVGTNAELQPAADAVGPDVTLRSRRIAAVQSTLATAQYRGAVVDELFIRALGRVPDSAGRAFWSRQLQTIGHDSVFASMLGSHEAFVRAGGTNQRFVDKLYITVLGRTANSGGEAFWLRRLAAGATRRSVAVSFVVSHQGRQFEVRRRYRTLLGREPDAGELAYWSDQLQTAPLERLLVTLVSSDEFLAIPGG